MMLQIFITVVSGVAVYVLSQLFTEFCLRPIQEYNKLKAKVAQCLVFYAACYLNPIDVSRKEFSQEYVNASTAIRTIAAEVSAFAELIPFRPFILFSIPPKHKIKTASEALIGISNSFTYSENCITQHHRNIRKAEIEIKTALRIGTRKKRKEEQKRFDSLISEDKSI